MFPKYHIPPTDCPYETDIYFYNLRGFVFPDVKSEFRADARRGVRQGRHLTRDAQMAPKHGGDGYRPCHRQQRRRGGFGEGVGHERVFH